MGYDLKSPLDRVAITRRIQEDIGAQCVEEFEEGPRTHLGASIIGDDCSWRVWAKWRWLKGEKFSGRMYRLFQRGKEEEAKFIRRLEAIGFKIYDFNPDTGKQYQITGCDGHFGGSSDSFAVAPERYGIPFALLLEFKTFNETNFTKLAGKVVQKMPDYVRKDPPGLKAAKPEHYKQMCMYGPVYEVNFGLYCGVNKNTDELYFEITELLWGETNDLYRKAEFIVYSENGAPKISHNAAYYECKMCSFQGVCHGGHLPDKNCRSCQHAKPVVNKQWKCERFDDIIPPDFMPKGCDDWKSII